MPSAYTSSQRSAIAQFTAFTQSSEKVAVRALKAYNWNVQQAVDNHFHPGQRAATAESGSASSPGLNKLFDSYRDSPKDSPDNIGIDGTMKYMSDLGVQLDEPVVLAVSEVLNSQSMGEFTRKDFIEGWGRLRADTIPKQQAVVTQLRSSLVSDAEIFRKVYRHTFLIARSAGQKSVALENALEYWKLLFTAPGGVGWSSGTTPWLEYWLEYVQSKWKKSINRDMWNMLLEFVQRTKQDESFGWWDEGGAWPSSLDDFALFVKEKRAAGGGDDKGPIVID